MLFYLRIKKDLQKKTYKSLGFTCKKNIDIDPFVSPANRSLAFHNQFSYFASSLPKKKRDLLSLFEGKKTFFVLILFFYIDLVLLIRLKLILHFYIDLVLVIRSKT